VCNCLLRAVCFYRLRKCIMFISAACAELAAWCLSEINRHGLSCQSIAARARLAAEINEA